MDSRLLAVRASLTDLNRHSLSASSLAVHRIMTFWLVIARPLGRRPNYFVLDRLGNFGLCRM